jgi:hypothetical protein
LKGGGKTWRLIVLIACAGLAVMWLLLQGNSAPSYKGKSLRKWMIEYSSSVNGRKGSSGAD